jgi:hypothetical protein
MAQQNGLQANGNNQPREVATSPYMSNDPNSNVANFKIIESTLRGKNISLLLLCTKDQFINWSFSFFFFY